MWHFDIKCYHKIPLVFYIWTLYIQRKTTYWQIIETGIPKITPKVNVPQILWSVQWPCLRLLCFIKWNVEISVWWRLLKRLYQLWRGIVPHFFHWQCTLDSRRVWPVSRGCLLLHGTWSHLLFLEVRVVQCSLSLYMFSGRFWRFWLWYLWFLYIKVRFIIVAMCSSPNF